MRSLVRSGELEIDTATRQVRLAGRLLDLEPKAFAVLVYLVERHERVVSKEELFSSVWPDVAVTDNALTRVIAQLRRELGDDAKFPRYIETVTKSGYRFVGAIENGTGPKPVQEVRRTVPGWWLWAAAGALVVAALALALLRKGPLNTPWPRQPRIEQVTNTTALDVSPSFSPDGSRIVFASNRTGRFQLYERSIRGGTERQITDLDEDAMHPALSPDGKWIAFVLGSKAKLSLMPAEGGSVRTLTEGAVFPAWSPDSSRLVFRVGMATTAREVASFEGTSLQTVSVNGGQALELTKPGGPPGGHNTPVWLADGRRVLFCATLGDKFSQPWTVDATTREIRKLADVKSAALNARLTSDGQWLYFNSLAGLMRKRLPDGVEELLVAAASQMPRDISISADGSRLVFSQVTDQTMLWRAPLDGQGEAGPFLNEVGVRVTSPSFSRDGERLSYTLLRRGAHMAIQVVDSMGGASRPLTGPETSGFLSVWTGNGDVGFMQLSLRGPAYWLQPLRSPGREIPFRLDKRHVRRLRISPDGKWLAGQISQPGEKSRLFVSDVATGDVRFISPPDRDVAFPAWFPDSRTIAAEERVDRGVATALVSTTVEGDPLETIVDERIHNWPHDVAQDNDTIAFAGLRDGVWNIYTVSKRSKRTRQVTRFTSKALLVRYPAISPVRNEVVFEYGESKGNVYVAELK